jgi:hypothetical protein
MAKNISTPTTNRTLIIEMNPAIAGYVLFQNGGRHGSVRLTKAVGRRCTNAVAIKTPVPKCRLIKMAWLGTGSRGNRRTITGKEQASVERKRMRNNAPTCTEVL